MTTRKGGRPRKSVELHVVGGNPSKLTEAELAARREEEAAVRPAPLRPTKPAGLSKVAGECWDRHAPELERLGLLTKMDAGAFVLACESFALAMEALGELRPRKADGTIDRRKRGLEVVAVDRAHGGMLKKHPAVAVYLQASGDYRRWCAEFGLTPAARMGLRPARSAPGGAAGGEGDGDGDGFELGY